MNDNNSFHPKSLAIITKRKIQNHLTTIKGIFQDDENRTFPKNWCFAQQRKSLLAPKRKSLAVVSKAFQQYATGKEPLTGQIVRQLACDPTSHYSLLKFLLVVKI